MNPGWHYTSIRHWRTAGDWMTIICCYWGRQDVNMWHSVIIYQVVLWLWRGLRSTCLHRAQSVKQHVVESLVGQLQQMDLK